MNQLENAGVECRSLAVGTRDALSKPCTDARIFIWARKLTLLNRYERKRPKVPARHRLVGSLPNVSWSCSACDRRFVQRNLGRRGARIGRESSNR